MAHQGRVQETLDEPNSELPELVKEVGRNRELRAMCYRKLSARPRHYSRAEGAIETLKKVRRPPRRAKRASTPPT